MLFYINLYDCSEKVWCLTAYLLHSQKSVRRLLVLFCGISAGLHSGSVLTQQCAEWSKAKGLKFLV